MTGKAEKHLTASGMLSVASLHVGNMDCSSVKLTIASKDDVIHLFPAQALIDGGRYSGDITYDRSGDIPRLSLDEHLAEVDMRRLLGDTVGKNRLSGRGNVSLNARAQGRGTQAMLASLNGRLVANLADGAIEGVDLGYEFGAAQALLARTPASKRDDTGRTKFDTFRISADISNGVATTKDLTISSQALRVTGQGSTNLSNKAIDFQLLASISTPSASIADIPLRVTGTYADPTVRPDLAKLVTGEIKQRLQDVLHDKLPGLFGKP
jgi:AsmA protein